LAKLNGIVKKQSDPASGILSSSFSILDEAGRLTPEGCGGGDWGLTDFRVQSEYCQESVLAAILRP
jgi:hypothetical protein